MGSSENPGALHTVSILESGEQQPPWGALQQSVEQAGGVALRYKRVLIFLRLLHHVALMDTLLAFVVVAGKPSHMHTPSHMQWPHPHATCTPTLPLWARMEFAHAVALNRCYCV